MQYTSKSIAIEYLELMIEKAELVIQRNEWNWYFPVVIVFVNKTIKFFGESYDFIRLFYTGFTL